MTVSEHPNAWWRRAGRTGLRVMRRVAGRVSRLVSSAWHGAARAFPRAFKWASDLTLGGMIRFAVMLLAAIVTIGTVGVFAFVHYPATQVPPTEPIDAYRYLDQGWGPNRDALDRQTYYYSPQGTSIRNLRYSWFAHLEKPWGKERLADPAHLRALGFIVDPVATAANPDMLPVGFARRYDRALRDEVLDISCAACHTGQINVTRDGKTTAIRIDGGPAMHAFTSTRLNQFEPVLLGAITSTYFNPFKFNRFARKVLGDARYPEGKTRLRVEFHELLSTMWHEFVNDKMRGNYPTEEGPGRTDALGRISNNVFATQLDEANYRPGNAPVSYPYLWNIWRFDWVQYTGSVSQPLARNVSEAMGTGATIGLLDNYGGPVPADQQFRTSIDFNSIHRIETTLQRLTPPRWPEDLLGPIDRDKAGRGEVLFRQRCSGCHGPHVAPAAIARRDAPGLPAANPLWRIDAKPQQRIGTDPTSALNFATRRVDLTKAGLDAGQVRRMMLAELQEMRKRAQATVDELTSQLASTRAKRQTADAARLESLLAGAHSSTLSDETIARRLDEVDLSSIGAGPALKIIGMMIREKYYLDERISPEQQECFNGFGALDLPRANIGYKPRPLEGVWATAPFLHNGSVPTLFDMLSPAYERPSEFYLGRREYDPVKVGFVTDRGSSTKLFLFNTRVAGNHNTGHEFRAGYNETAAAAGDYQYGVIGPALTVDERFAIIEYLKVHRDEAPPPTGLPDCFALLKDPTR
jgi:hypothetical protein